MSAFESARVNEQTLKVKTPFQITYPVWDVFVLQTFPEFRLPLEFDPNESWTTKYPYYLNRENTSSGSRGVIANGQQHPYWNHAYLPDDERTGFNSSDTGFIYVPKEQSFYLDEISQDYTNNSAERSSLLKYLNYQQKTTLQEIFDTYNKVTLTSLKDKNYGSIYKFTECLQNTYDPYPYDRTVPYLVLKESSEEIEKKFRYPKEREINYNTLLDVGSQMYKECETLL